jgi:prepilin-type N-terminal cleavage/methylation domain-containing protein
VPRSPLARLRAFTLIELLVVVAIIAILAAIAVPNFLEAQKRAKVSRVKADMRSTATAVESYVVDYNRYPWDYYDNGKNEWDTWRQLTTPISYMTSTPLDVFVPGQQREPYDYGAAANRPNPAQMKAYAEAGFTYVFLSRGPNTLHEWDWYSNGNDGSGENLLKTALDKAYDPTNGTISNGMLFRAQRGIIGG